MQKYNAGEYDVVVIGGGHAGCEAALASARLGCNTIMFAINLDSIANMPCNPNVGGTAKGHLVRELDALGGEMGKVTDKVFIQSRILNKGKGPAVYSLRAQVDRRAYQVEMKHRLELTPNLDIKQAEIVEVKKSENSWEVMTHTGATFTTKSIVIATGTFLRGRIIIGEVSYNGGPDGLFAANSLSASLKDLGIELMRFKTGTPARVNRSSVDFTGLEPQHGDDEIVPFSFETKEVGENKALCYLTYTNEKTHQIIKDNLHRSPLYSGDIEGVGPRYCPSIEDKVVRFSDKDHHQLFIEPMGLSTEEMYVQGMSSSLPEDVQIQMLQSIKGLENVKMMRSAYAIEYDCIPPTQLKQTLEFKHFPGLFGAGQFNGSSGYEEAASQGLIAGINAARFVSNKEGITLRRDQAYIGVLIDDLVTKGTAEPYRMMTARAEYRLLLRQDNADLRLTPIGHDIGLISDERFNNFLNKKANIEKEIERLEKTIISPLVANPLLEKLELSALSSGARLSELLRRPQLTYKILEDIDPNRPILDKFEAEQVEITVKYQGYIKRQLEQAEQLRKLENTKIPEATDFSIIDGLRIEAKQKLEKLRPATLGQASRISGVSPADIGVLLVFLKASASRK